MQGKSTTQFSMRQRVTATVAVVAVAAAAAAAAVAAAAVAAVQRQQLEKHRRSKGSGCVGSSRAKTATTGGGGESSNGNENAVRESREKAVGGNANGAMSECCLLPYLGEESQLNSVSHFQQRRSQPISRKRKAEAAAAVATTAAGRCDSRDNGGVSWQLQRNWRQWR